MIADLIALTLADPQVFASIGQRLRPYVRDQRDATPAATVNVVSGVPDIANDGPTGYEVNRVQIDVYATGAALVYSTAQAIKDRLHGYSGVYGSTRFLGIMIDSERSTFDGGVASENKLFRISIDFMVHWRKTA